MCELPAQNSGDTSWMAMSPVSKTRRSRKYIATSSSKFPMSIKSIFLWNHINSPCMLFLSMYISIIIIDNAFMCTA